MTGSEERRRILAMVAEGKITAEEAAALLQALSPALNQTSEGGKAPPSAMRVRLTDLDSGRILANVVIPITLVDVGMRMGAKFAPELDGVDLNKVMNKISSGVRGKVIDVEDIEQGEKLEIFVE
ncbi:MAG: hypothetical protein GYB64_10710 [Chloroflexi bacterium]|nr:hypothetical protein [Chloroflexota bacterium]